MIEGKETYLFEEDDMETVYKILFSLFNQDFTITEKRYIEHEDDTGYHHYAIDVAKHYLFPKEEDET